MTLDELIGSGAITSVVHRASEAGPGALFCALPGLRADGHDYVAEAASRGAAAAVVERQVPGVAIPQVVVPDARLAMALAAAAVAGHPSDDLLVVGVTGTNGKTTSAFLLRAVLEAAGHRTGLIGTIEARVGGQVLPVAHTTPDAVELQALFGRMRDAGDTACAMEVSSHALMQRRVAGTRFAAALFTNLTRDHLDYHPDVESYFAAKRRLFARPEEEGPDPPGASNLDDEFGARLARETGALGFAVDAPAPVRPAGVARPGDGDRDDRRHPARAGRDREPSARPLQPGQHHRGRRPGRAARAAARGGGGRNRVGARRARAVRGDRRGPAASRSSSTTPTRPTRSTTCSGRPASWSTAGGSWWSSAAAATVTGASARRWARWPGPSRTWRSSPRTIPAPRTRTPSSPTSCRGRPARRSSIVEPDRRAAIGWALSRGDRGDVVVIAGKGHEQGQERNGVKTPFDDREVARAELGAGAAA